MKKYFLKISWALLVLTAVAPAAFAGDSTHGGNGVIQNGKPYLLDLMEANLATNPYLAGPSSTYASQVANAILSKMPQAGPRVAAIVATKFHDLYGQNALFEALLKRLLFRFNWIFVNNELIDVQDADSLESFGDMRMVQLAVRRGATITINLTWWSLMDDANKAATILHEVLYALFDGFSETNNNSNFARQLNASLFQQSTFAKSRIAFAQYLVDSGLSAKGYASGRPDFVTVVDPDYKAAYWDSLVNTVFVSKNPTGAVYFFWDLSKFGRPNQEDGLQETSNPRQREFFKWAGGSMTKETLSDDVPSFVNFDGSTPFLEGDSERNAYIADTDIWGFWSAEIIPSRLQQLKAGTFNDQFIQYEPWMPLNN